MAVFNTPKPDNNIDSKLELMVRSNTKRRNSIRALTESAAEDKEAKETAKKMDDIDKESNKKSSLESLLADRRIRVNKNNINKAVTSLEHRLYEEGRKQVFNNIIFEMVYNACWIDEAVKDKTLEKMYETFYQVIENLNDNNIEVDMESNVTKFIANVHTAVNEVCSKAAKRIASETLSIKRNYDSDDDINNINFDLDDEETDELDDSLSGLGKEDIEELVKQKVLAVVQDEKQKGEEKAADLDELKKSSEEDDDDDDNDDDDDDEKESTKESFNQLVKRNRRMKEHRRTGSSLFECLMMHNVCNLRKEAVTMENFVASNNQIMNAALQESILVYTTMEMLNTLKLCKFDNVNTNRLSKFYMNGIN